MVVRASVLAEPATIDIKGLDGSSAGTASLALRVADPDSSKGLVHRYLVMIRQNARRVSQIEKTANKSHQACVATSLLPCG